MQASTRPPELTRGGSRQSLASTAMSSRGASPTEETSRLSTVDSGVTGGSPGQQRRDSQGWDLYIVFTYSCVLVEQFGLLPD